MNWDDLRHLLAIARGGSLAAAARRLKVDQTTVARRLRTLEANLGALLFERREGTLHPTAAGEAALARAAQVEQEVLALEQGIGRADSAPAGLVRVTAVPIIVNRLLIPGLPALHASHPGIRLELAAESRNLSLTRREADVALRLGRLESGGGVLARRIAHLKYAAVYGPTGEDCAVLPWITYEEGLGHLPQARWIAAAGDGASLAPFAVSDVEAILHAIRRGLGKSLLPCFAGDGDPELQRLGAGEVVLRRELWMLSHRDLRHHGRIAAVIGWIGDLLKSKAY